jgi:hypothetical protein
MTKDVTESDGGIFYIGTDMDRKTETTEHVVQKPDFELRFEARPFECEEGVLTLMTGHPCSDWPLNFVTSYSSSVIVAKLH